mgnify:CR=1 FL=1
MGNVPNLRFPEFTGEWKKCKLKDVCTFYSGGTPSSSNKDYYNGDIPFIRSGELHSDKTELFISSKGLKNSSAKMVSKGDLLLALYGATSGDIAISQIEGAINQAILCIKTDQSKGFIEATWCKHVKRILQTYLQGGQGNLSADIVKNIAFYFAPLKEQEKLTQLMKLLDERIATQNKIIEKLQSLIKGLIDDIITLKCGQLVAFETLYSKAGEGGTPTTSNTEFYDNGSIPFIKIDDLSNKYLSANKDYITELGLKKSSAWLIPTHSIIYSNGATIGAISINKYPVCTKQGILGIVPNTNIDVEFLYYFMQSSYFQKEVERVVTEGTMKTAYLKDINHIKCPIPDLDRQKEISHLLSVLSLKEDVERQLLQKYQIQKQYLLRKMFI